MATESPTPFVVLGYSGDSPSAEQLTQYMKKYPETLIVLTREELMPLARQDFEAHLVGSACESAASLFRVCLSRAGGRRPESPEMQDAVANLLVGLRHRKGNVVVWIEPGDC